MKRNLSIMSLAAFSILLLTGCATTSTSARQQDRAMVAATFSKAATLIFLHDFAIDEPVTREFSASELTMLREQLQYLVPMIDQGLDCSGNVWAAKLAGHFKMQNTLPALRAQLLEPRACYGWEGPDYSVPESYLADMQYPYSIEYLRAIEQITGKPVGKTVILSTEERKTIDQLTENPDSEYHHWAIWLQRKLAIVTKGR